MLQHLYIQNYALIESLDIDFNEGFTVITGETGAGKSILLGALNLILGKRADIASLKDKSKKCIVEATFKIKDYGLKPLFEQNDLDYEDQTIFRREINVGGKSRAFINDTPVNLNLIKNIGDRLINIHSQDDQISLGDSAFQMAVVDSVAGAGELNLKYKKQYKLFIQLRSRLDALYEQQKQASDEKDYLQFLFDELEETQMKSGEQEQLEEEQELLNHTEEIKGTLYKANQNLNDDEEGILQNLATLKSNIEKISGYSPTLSDIASRVNSAFIELSDLSDEIENSVIRCIISWQGR
ncbi:MAG: AAA family ATPase [Bacteroidales bacterium]